MATRRKSIQVFAHDRQHLIELYLQRRIPVDQYVHRPDDLGALTDDWCAQTGRTESPSDVLHYMRTQRKRGLWVTFDGAHEIVPATPVLTPDQTEALIALYAEHIYQLLSGSDDIGYAPEIVEWLAKEFHNETGRSDVSGYELVAILTALRKRGLLPKVGDVPKKDPSIGFDDIDDATGS